MKSIGIIALFILVVCIDMPNILKKATGKGKTISAYGIIILAAVVISLLQASGKKTDSPSDLIGNVIKGIFGEK